MTTWSLPADDILGTAPPPPASPAKTAARPIPLGRSREGREIAGYRFGHGETLISLIGGCHADEPVGPALLERLCAWLATRPAVDPLLSKLSWWIVPHINPDGAARNAAWAEDAAVAPANAYDLFLYLRHALREPPGDDIEYGFPTSPEDTEARPENLAVAAFLRDAVARRGAPFALHASLHGMAFATGPWFLLERGWADRTVELRTRLRERVRALGYRIHDIDRGGDKGFHHIDEGFTSRPDSVSMRAHFEARGDHAMAALFRPSSMEFVRSLGGDPLTLVTEMPLFVIPPPPPGDDLIRPRVTRVLAERSMGGDAEALHATADELGVRPMSITDQMRFQLAYLEEGLAAVL